MTDTHAPGHEVAPSPAGVPSPHYPVTYGEQELRIEAELDLEGWAEVGSALARISGGAQWWVGDWLVWGEAAFGERHAQGLPTEYAGKSLANLAWVASRIPPERRVRGLSFSHHATVAGLEPEEQDRLLLEAMARGLTVQDLRAEVALVSSRRPTTPPAVAFLGVVRYGLRALARCVNDNDGIGARLAAQDLADVLVAFAEGDDAAWRGSTLAHGAQEGTKP